MYVCMYICVYVCMYMCVCMYVCMYVCIGVILWKCDSFGVKDRMQALLQKGGGEHWDFPP